MYVEHEEEITPKHIVKKCTLFTPANKNSTNVTCVKYSYLTFTSVLFSSGGFEKCKSPKYNCPC